MTTVRKPRPRPQRAAGPLARVRKLCLALPDTTEKIAWGAPTFRVKGKIFVMYADNHHKDGRVAIWCMAPAGAQKTFVAADPEHFFVPPYVGPYGWLGVRLDRKLSWSVTGDIIEEAWRERGGPQLESPKRQRGSSRNSSGSPKRQQGSSSVPNSGSPTRKQVTTRTKQKKGA